MNQSPTPDEIQDRSAPPGPATRFTLASGVQLEPLGDGSAVLYSRDLDQSLSLNHTAALLCSFADGRHTVEDVLQEMCLLFPDARIEESALLDLLQQLRALRFLQWV
jgi:hypothetical protein